MIDSVTRRSFRSDPTRTVLLTYGPTYKDNTGRSSSRHWRRLFVLNPERHDFLEDLRTFGRLWAYGETDNPDRVLFFARYLGHSDHVLHNMALVEIGRAPYALVRPLSDRVPASLVLQEFSDINRFAYRSAAIRLLGLQSRSPGALVCARAICSFAGIRRAEFFRVGSCWNRSGPIDCDQRHWRGPSRSWQDKRTQKSVDPGFGRSGHLTIRV